jgi:hypothetical protein
MTQLSSTVHWTPKWTMVSNTVHGQYKTVLSTPVQCLALSRLSCYKFLRLCKRKRFLTLTRYIHIPNVTLYVKHCIGASRPMRRGGRVLGHRGNRLWRGSRLAFFRGLLVNQMNE